MTKLSKVQSSVIDRLKNGEKLSLVTGVKPYCYFSNDFKNVGWNTIFKLEDLKLIKRDEINKEIKLL